MQSGSAATPGAGFMRGCRVELRDRSDQAGPLQQFAGRVDIVEFALVEVREAQILDRGQAVAALDLGVERELRAVLRHDLLPALGRDQPVQELLRGLGLAAAGQHPGAGGQHQRTRVLAVEEVHARGDLVGTTRAACQDVPVIVVGQAERMLPGLDAVAHLAVLLLVDAVFADRGEPGQGRLRADAVDQVTGGGAEGTGRGVGEAALPLGLAQVEDAGGQVRLGNQLRVVEVHPRARRPGQPAAVGRGEAAGGLGEGRRRHRQQQAAPGEVADRPGLLGDEDIGLGARALLDDLVGERAILATAHLHLDAGVAGEGLGQGIGHALVLAGIQHQARGRGRARRDGRRFLAALGSAGGECERGQQGQCGCQAVQARKRWSGSIHGVRLRKTVG